MIASQDSWAREQHSRHCDANRRRRAASQQPAASGWPGRHRAEDDENKFAPSVQHENWDRYETRSPAANTAEEAWGWSRYADDNATTNHADDSRSWTRNDEGGNCATTWRWRDHYSERNNWNHGWGHNLPTATTPGWRWLEEGDQSLSATNYGWRWSNESCRQEWPNWTQQDQENHELATSNRWRRHDRTNYDWH